MKTAILAVAAAVVFVALIYPRRTYNETHWPNGNARNAWSDDADGRPHGLSRRFREDGSLESETRFVHGVWTEVRYYHPNGKVSEEKATTDNGDRVRTWNENGELIHDSDFKSQ